MPKVTQLLSAVAGIPIPVSLMPQSRLMTTPFGLLLDPRASRLKVWSPERSFITGELVRNADIWAPGPAEPQSAL